MPLPGPNWTRNVSEGDNRLFLPDSATNTPPTADVLPPGTDMDLDLVPEIAGDDHFLIARVLSVSVLDFGTQGVQAIARVARGTTLTYDAGRLVHTVSSPEGVDYALFSISESATSTWDPTVLNGLAGLDLPDGWSYSSEVLSEALVIGTPDSVAEVFTVPDHWTWQRVVVVPEPSTALLIGLGLAGLASRQRRESELTVHPEA